MTKRETKILEWTCNRCGDIERWESELKDGRPASPPTSTSLIVNLMSDDPIEVLKGVLEKAGYKPDATIRDEARLHLCKDCCVKFAKFMEQGGGSGSKT